MSHLYTTSVAYVLLAIKTYKFAFNQSYRIFGTGIVYKLIV